VGECLKINTDGAFIEKEKASSGGFIIKDCLGEVILAGAANVMPVRDALMAEAWACKIGLEAVVSQGISNIVLEMDSAILKGALTSDDRDLVPEGAFIGGLREFILDNFASVQISNVSRSCNSLAHAIAKVGLSWDPGQAIVWQDHLSDFVTAAAARDLAEQMINITEA
jgi:ribonuclease HI